MNKITLSEYDLKQWRERALWPRHKRSKAEKHFDLLMEGKNAHKVKRNDYDAIMMLHATYWDLQDLILDEKNTDAQMQQNYIQQQNDILDECERIYNKYINAKD